MRWTTTILLTLALTGCSTAPVQPETIETSTSTTSLPPQEGVVPGLNDFVVFTGRGEMNTERFYASGDLVVDWKTTGDCIYLASLNPADGSVNLRPTMDYLLNTDGKASGSNRIYALQPGYYFVEMTTGPTPGCPWSIEIISPQDPGSKRVSLREPVGSLMANGMGAGIGSLSLGDCEAAMSSFQSVLTLKPNDVLTALANYNIGVTLQQCEGKPKDSIQYYSQALEIAPRFVYALYNRATSYRSLGDNSRAISGFRTLLTLRPDDADVMQQLGDILVKTGSTAEGEAFLARAYAIDPTLRS